MLFKMKEKARIISFGKLADEDEPSESHKQVAYAGVCDDSEK